MRSLAGLSLGAFYLAAVVAVMARIGGTCTQGDAGRLFGAAAALSVLALAAILARGSGRPRLVLIGLAPLAPVYLWQAGFAAHLAVETAWRGRPACDVLEGTAKGFPPDGAEAVFAALWLALAVASLAVVALLARDARAAARPPPAP
ncbi:MAG: hypothetical protein AAFU61_10395 [Pseudomonadota bacterium]